MSQCTRWGIPLWLAELIGLASVILFAWILTGCGQAWTVDFNDDGTLKSIKLDGREVPVAYEPAALAVSDPEPVAAAPEPEPDAGTPLAPPVPATPFSRARDLLAQLEAAGRFREARDLCQRLVQLYGRAVRTPWNFGSNALVPIRRPRAIDDPLRNGADAADELDRWLQPHR